MTLVENSSGTVTNRGDTKDALAPVNSETAPSTETQGENITPSADSNNEVYTPPADKVVPPDDNSDLENKDLTQSAKEAIIEERAFNKSIR